MLEWHVISDSPTLLIFLKDLSNQVTSPNCVLFKAFTCFCQQMQKIRETYINFLTVIEGLDAKVQDR